MRYFLGIDGGGTKTTAVICDENLMTVATTVGESINFNSVGTETARKNLKSIVDIVTEKAGCVKTDACFIGMSALADAADETFVREFCSGVIECPLIGMNSDVYIGLESMLIQGPAAMVICGTGSMTAGRLADGSIIHKGGWGYILGDEGSAYAIASDAIKAALCGYEGSGEKTALSGKLLEYYGAAEYDGLIDLFYNPPMSRSRIAAFTSAVFECADSGDETAKNIIGAQAKKLADTVCALLAEMPDGTPLGMWGGVFQHHKEYADIFSETVVKEYPETKTGLVPYSPEYGAVFAAMKMAGLDPEKAVGREARL